MIKTNIYIKGIEQFERVVHQIQKEVNKEKADLLLSQARLVRERIKEKAPLGPTGYLKTAAYANVLRSADPVVAFAGIRPRKAPHAHLVEYGHAGPHPAPPHPFFRPAWDEMREQAYRNIKEGLRRIALRTP